MQTDFQMYNNSNQVSPRNSNIFVDEEAGKFVSPSTLSLPSTKVSCLWLTPPSKG